MEERWLSRSLKTHKKLRLKQSRMRDISFTAVLRLGAQELETATLMCRFRRMAANEMEVLHSVSQLVHLDQQFSIDAVRGDGSE